MTHPAIVRWETIEGPDWTYDNHSEPMGRDADYGRHFGLARLGIHHVRLQPGRRSSFPHAESAEDEFVYVIAGTPDVWLDGHLHRLAPGDAVGFPAGTGLSHTFLNNTDADVRLIVAGDRPREDNRIVYPLNPAEMAVRQDAWRDAPDRELGPHDGLTDHRRLMEQEQPVTRVHGYIRFSFLGRSDARASREGLSKDDRAAEIFAPLRMAQRFHLFEHICLPSLRAQTHADFRIVVVCSPQMPAVYLEKLQALVATLPQGEILISDAENIITALDPCIAAATAKAKGMTFHFRLDDDDALCTTAIATMDRYCDTALPNELLSFPRGFLLAQHEGEVHLLHKYEDYIAIGFGYFSAPGKVRNPYSGAHRRIYRRLPSRMDPRVPTYIHVAHLASDTAQNNEFKLMVAQRGDPEHAKEETSIAELVEKHFPFKVPELRHIMAAMPGAVPHDPPLASGDTSG